MYKVSLFSTLVSLEMVSFQCLLWQTVNNYKTCMDSAFGVSGVWRTAKYKIISYQKKGAAKSVHQEKNIFSWFHKLHVVGNSES